MNPAGRLTKSNANGKFQSIIISGTDDTPVEKWITPEVGETDVKSTGNDGLGGGEDGTIRYAVTGVIDGNTPDHRGVH